ncbi:MAG: hypothetical protein ACM3JD_17520 [Rudaea sp.]
MFRTFGRFSPMIALMLAAVVVLAACSGGGGDGSNAPVQVQVNLTEMKIDSSVTAFKVGVPYHFVVKNAGTVNHEFMIMPPVAPGKMSMEEMDKMGLVGIDGEELPPGATKTADYTFTKAYPAGQLEMACHLTGHYEGGMHLPVTVQ